MTQINLLPWREQERQARKVRFMMILAGTVGCALVLVAILHFYYSSVISNQKSRNAYLQMQITQEQAKLSTLNKKKKELLAIDEELHFLISLKEKSFSAVRILDELARVVPEAVSLNKITRDGNQLTILGKARSNLEITLLMKNIDKSPLFKQPELTEITGKENAVGEERNFQLKVELEEAKT